MSINAVLANQQSWHIQQGDVLDVLRRIPDGVVQCVVTSPPYFALRDYGIDGQIGLETTPEEYVARLVAVFREVRRVLREDGTVWCNLGDSYAGSGRGLMGDGTPSDRGDAKQGTNRGTTVGTFGKIDSGLKPKNLIGIPWRVAFALQADGWWLRSDVIWHKPNCLPESVTDRPTKAHEYIFLLTKSARYFYDAEAVKEEAVSGSGNAGARNYRTYAENGRVYAGQSEQDASTGRNKRTVWTISTQPYSESHFATFPPELPEICIKAGSSERGACPQCGAPWERIIRKGLTAHDGETESAYDKGTTANRLARLRQAARERGEEYRNETQALGWRPTCTCDAGEPVPQIVLDPFAGAGTTLMVALRLGRRALGIELNGEYVAMAERRIVGDCPLFNGVLGGAVER